jgi:ABC-type transport system substrate-binding protein
VLTLVLLQSYLWVPTYEQQAKGNPDRLSQYINASIGDAAILNPILSADTASSEIESKVFEGLIDRDEDLRFRGRLSTSWKIYETAYFFVNAAARIPEVSEAAPQHIIELLRRYKEDENLSPPELKKAIDNIQKISLIPPRNYTVTKLKKAPGDSKKTTDIKIHISAPARFKLLLKDVDQDLFNHLALLLGDEYFSMFKGEKFMATDPPVDAQMVSAYAKELLPATEHNPIIEFTLRPGVKFHDGHMFDADDVRFTYEAIMNPKNLSPRIADYEPVKSVEVIDPLKIRIVYKRLYAPAIESWAMGILPEHLLSSEALKKEALSQGKDPQTFHMRQSSFNRHPVGCGPYVFGEWKSDQYIMLNRFDDYWEGPPNYQKYVMRIIPDLLTQEMEFYAGTIDSYGVPPHQVKRLKEDPKYQSFSATSLSYSYIGYNLRRKPFDDARVRRALGMAIDVDKIIKYVLYHQGERTTGPFAKQTDFYNSHIKPLPYDPEGAQKLLNDAGWVRNKEGWLEKDGKKLQFTLITNSGNDIRKAILAIAQDAWKQIGIDVRTDLLEWSVFLQERVNKFDFDALILGWTTPIDPDPFQVWHSSQTGPNQLNFVGFKNKAADALIIKIRQEYNHERQVELCHKFHEIIAREQPYTFLFVRKATAILDKRIVIQETDTLGNVIYKKITPNKIGDYSFHFNKWVKLSEMPNLTP